MTMYFIRKKSDPDAFWSSGVGWTDRIHADLHGDLSLTSPAIHVPPEGVWVDSYYDSLEEYYDKQEHAGIPVDEAVRPRFPFVPMDATHLIRATHLISAARTTAAASSYSACLRH